MRDGDRGRPGFRLSRLMCLDQAELSRSAVHASRRLSFQGADEGGDEAGAALAASSVIAESQSRNIAHVPLAGRACRVSNRLWSAAP